MSYAQGGKREGVAAQGNAVGPAEGKQIEQPQQTQGALANGDGLARQLRQAQEALANGDVLAKRSCGKCKRRSPMEMCWRRGPVASYIFSLSFIYYLCGRDIYLSIYIFALYSILV